MSEEYYYIDTIKDDTTASTLYYVCHQKRDGNVVVVGQAFYNYWQAEALRDELNDDLVDYMKG